MSSWRAIVGLGAACLGVGTVAPAMSPLCLEALLELNENAVVPLASYDVPNDREVEKYRLLFAEQSLSPARPESEFDRAVDGLRPGDVVGDVGSGLSVAMLQLAGGPSGAHTVAFNTQSVRPVYERVLGLPAVLAAEGSSAIRSFRTAPGRSLSGEWVTSIGGVHTNVLRAMYRATNRPEPEFLKIPLRPGYVLDVEAVRAELSELGRELRVRLDGPRFRLETGFAESRLGEYRGRMRLLVDAYGGFFYGATRLELLRAYYDALAPGGKAFIFLDKRSEYGWDEVTLRDGRRTTLIEYLTATYPGRFRLGHQGEGENRRYFLILEKPATAGPFSLPLEVTDVGYYHEDRRRGYVVPRLAIRER